MSIQLQFIRRLRNKLLAAELKGIGQRKLWIAIKTKNFTKVDDMLYVLIDWQSRKWVDSYLVNDGTRGRPKTVWRATKLLRTDWEFG